MCLPRACMLTPEYLYFIDAQSDQAPVFTFDPYPYQRMLTISTISLPDETSSRPLGRGEGVVWGDTVFFEVSRPRAPRIAYMMNPVVHLERRSNRRSSKFLETTSPIIRKSSPTCFICLRPRMGKTPRDATGIVPSSLRAIKQLILLLSSRFYARRQYSSLETRLTSIALIHALRSVDDVIEGTWNLPKEDWIGVLNLSKRWGMKKVRRSCFKRRELN
jgi:hypothetical protein